ncbi:hypothetical protein MKEN_01148900 [Mycena kentingensis (nom. inval.)]|nr:hypothetical protein MKEN_01148900 [Mycena kentingensis (nom. inval.)]
MVNLQLVYKLRIFRRQTAPTNATPTGDPPSHTRHTKLAGILQVLRLAESAAKIAPVPFLEGSIALTVGIVECVQGSRANNDALERLAEETGNLLVGITQPLQAGGSLPLNVQPLFDGLYRTLEEIYRTATEMVKTDGWIRRGLAQKEYTTKIAELRNDVSRASMAFMTQIMIVDMVSQSQSEDTIYEHSKLSLDEVYASGDSWIAHLATLSETKEVVLVKQYKELDIHRRLATQNSDIKAFKNLWNPNLLQFMGRSRPGSEHAYIVLRGLTSAHVTRYIGNKFSESTKFGSVEALRLLKDLTNAFVFVVQSASSSWFDISSVHLNDSGKVILVNLEPMKVEKSTNNMPHWNRWQAISIELLAGDPLYEPNPSI